MPALVRFEHCVIYMYAADHPPPHFHIRMKDGREVLVEIGADSPMRGEVAAQELREPLAWARRHCTLLKAKWRELNT